MLKLKNIIKDYSSGDTIVKALKGIDIEFRENEFVSILGPSGCGKTTLLNIIGGLDKYTSGDLIINGKSTKKYKDSDWDSYRNHSIGFVFQSYNLISHQTVLSNVELAMTLSGVGKSERRQRAVEALEKVGLGDQLHKKPNQMSGGQMQRVAIARALVNDPDIILADEPTGALDSATSIQIMEILKNISKDKLIIMVTHNPELASTYSTRIVKLLDGKLTDDSDPMESENDEAFEEKKTKKTSMSFFTAISLSFNNLLTKKGRTFLTSFAGSIGIIGIALILALSSGVQNYINKTEKEALANYPLMITKDSSDFSEIFSAMSGVGTKEEETETEEGKVYSNNMMSSMINSMIAGKKTNNMKEFKNYLESNECDIDKYVSDIRYLYSTTLNIYKEDTGDGLCKVNPSPVMEKLGMQSMIDTHSMYGGSAAEYDVWSQIPDNEDYLESQYEVLAGKLPERYDEVMIITDENGTISDYCLYTLGIESMERVEKNVKDAMLKRDVEVEDEEITSYTYDELLNLKYKILINTDYFRKNDDGTWEDNSDDDMYVISKLSDALEIKVTGIVKVKKKGTEVSASGGVGYRSDLMEYVVNKVNESEIAKQQKENPDVDVFTGIKFETDDSKEDVNFSMEDFNQYMQTLSEQEQAEMSQYMQQMQQMGMTQEDIMKMMSENVMVDSTDATYEDNMNKLGISDLDEPAAIYVYPKDFEMKDNVTEIIDDYNDTKKNEEDKISYTDYIGLMLSSVTTIINAITYVLVGFVSISLVVSSIMIGIITYISVLERTKEIGILRAIGASKRDVSRVFNAETFIIGFVSGALGIGVTVLLCIPANMIIKHLTGITGIAVLPWYDGVILVMISMALTMIAGLVPAKMAAKKDPVVALRTE